MVKYLSSLLVLLVLGSCSPYWHIQRAIKKDPSLSRLDTIIEIKEIKTPTFEAIFSPSTERSVIINMIAKDSLKDSPKTPVRLKLIPLPDGKIKAEIDCPPVQVKTVKIPVMIPVENELSEWKLFWKAKGMIFSALVFGFIFGILLTILVRRKFPP